MNNVYYRFTHLVGEQGLRDHAGAAAHERRSAKPGVDKVDFELWSLAVSAINGCGMCMDSHEQVVAKKGVEQGAVQAVVRIAAVIHAVAATLDAEEKLAA